MFSDQHTHTHTHTHTHAPYVPRSKIVSLLSIASIFSHPFVMQSLLILFFFFFFQLTFVLRLLGNLGGVYGHTANRHLYKVLSSA